MKAKVFLCAFFVISLLIGASVFFPENAVVSQKQTLVEFPEFVTNGKINTAFTNELSNYITENVAFRDRIISINAYLRNTFFHSSSQEKVIVGKDGMLFFSETLGDYLGTEKFTEREKFNFLDTLEQMQEYCDKNSIKFAFTVVPNKNTLYGDNMPKRYKKASSSNLEDLLPDLNKTSVNFVDLTKTFKSLDGVYYYKTDTHWTQKGAIIGYENILSSIYDDYVSFKDIPMNTPNTHRGDLGEMLYPGFEYTESETVLDYTFGYKTVGRFKSADDINIRTVNPNGKHSLLMFRDSFGVALLPLMAENFNSMYYTRQVPVDLTLATADGRDTVIYEIVERNMKNVILYSPVFEANTVTPGNAVDCEYSLHTDKYNSLIHFYGKVNSTLGTNQKIYVQVLDEAGDSVYYNTVGAFTEYPNEEYSDSCFSAYVDLSALPENYKVNVVLEGE